MPNGHGEQPDLDVTNPGSLGRYLGWLGGVVSDLYSQQVDFRLEVRGRLHALDEFKADAERATEKQLAVMEAKAEARAAFRRKLHDVQEAVGAFKWIIATAILSATIGGGGCIAVYQFVLNK